MKNLNYFFHVSAEIEILKVKGTVKEYDGVWKSTPKKWEWKNKCIFV